MDDTIFIVIGALVLGAVAVAFAVGLALGYGIGRGIRKGLSDSAIRTPDVARRR